MAVTVKVIEFGDIFYCIFNFCRFLERYVLKAYIFWGAKATRFYRARPGAKLQALQGACGSLSFGPQSAPLRGAF
jgi:hypothetical protein